MFWPGCNLERVPVPLNVRRADVGVALKKLQNQVGHVQIDFPEHLAFGVHGVAPGAACAVVIYANGNGLCVRQGLAGRRLMFYLFAWSI